MWSGWRLEVVAAVVGRLRRWCGVGLGWLGKGLGWLGGPACLLFAFGSGSVFGCLGAGWG